MSTNFLSIVRKHVNYLDTGIFNSLIRISTLRAAKHTTIYFERQKTERIYLSPLHIALNVILDGLLISLIGS